LRSTGTGRNSGETSRIARSSAANKKSKGEFRPLPGSTPRSNAKRPLLLLELPDKMGGFPSFFLHRPGVNRAFFYLLFRRDSSFSTNRRMLGLSHGGVRRERKAFFNPRICCDRVSSCLAMQSSRIF
jgi:hypothetical protein